MASEPFISYSQNDRAAAYEFRLRLNQAGIGAFQDASDLRSGDRWLQRLQQALATCRALVVLVGRDGVHRWMAGEVEAALNRHLSASDGTAPLPIHPVLLPGASTQSLPPFLALFQARPWQPGEELPPDLVQALQQGTPGLERGSRIEGCPYLGLSSFGVEHARLFFGRRSETLAALSGLGDQRDVDPLQASSSAAGHVRWLQIEGHSGSGKSSLVKAGLLPMVLSGALWPRTGLSQWCILGPMVPGRDPVNRLAEALEHGLKVDPHQRDSMARACSLRRGSGALAMSLRDHKPEDTGYVLVIDQLEEIFTLAQGASSQVFEALLADALQDAECPLYVISTVRSDFIDRFPQLPRLSALLNSRCKRLLLPTITQEGLREVIEGPARLAGLEVTEVTTAMLREAEGEPGALPLVEHALMQLWQQRRDAKLSGELFAQAGGLAGMLSSSADALLSRIEAEQSKVGRIGALELLLALTRINVHDSLRHIRQRISRIEAVHLAGQGDAVRGEHVLQALSGQQSESRSGAVPGNLRLVIVGIDVEQTYVELIHETLVRARPADPQSGGGPTPYWPTLYDYIQANRDRDALRQQLALLVGRWQRAGRWRSWMRLATWGQLWDLRRLSLLPQSAEGKFLGASRRLAVAQMACLAALTGASLQGVWWVRTHNLPASYAFVQPLWALGWIPEPAVLNLPPGRFTMGCKEGRDVGRDGACKLGPLAAREVALTNPCAMGRSDVTFLEYDRFVWAMRGRLPYPDDAGWGRFDRPVIHVSWDEAQAYAAWLSQATGKSYRLPTEEEWEYAARGGIEARFPWGDEAAQDRANCVDCGGPNRTTPVRSYPPNGFRLHDMAGNVWQWVGEGSGKIAGAASDATRPLRGGSWYNYSKDLRVSHRNEAAPGNRDNNIGFRVCRDSSPGSRPANPPPTGRSEP